MNTKKPFVLNKIKIFFCIIAIIFVLFLLVLLFLDSQGKETPLLRFSELSASLFDKQSPEDYVKEQDIKVYSDRIVIFIHDATLSRYAATKSMDPVLDSSANGIEIPVKNTEQIHVGDIITYEDENHNLIVHRVIRIGQDSEGWFCITKGDNSPAEDGKIRFEQIKFLTIAIIY